jgi:uncharacterized protein with ParB-like and HNH nuclease domain
MTKISNVTSYKEPLSDFLKSIQTDRIQLPDFQRDWAWDKEGGGRS